MSRLDDIVARNRPPHWSRDPVVRAVVIAVLVIAVFVLVAFTRLAQPAAPERRKAQRLDGILLRAAPPDAGASR